MVPGIVLGSGTDKGLQVPDGLFKLGKQGASDVLATIYAFEAGGTRHELWRSRFDTFEKSLDEVWRQSEPVHWLMVDPAQVPSDQSASKHLVKLEIAEDPDFRGYSDWEVVASLTLKIGEPNGDFRTAGLYGYGAWIRDPDPTRQSATEYKFAYVFDGNVGFPPQVHLQRVLMTEVREGGSNVGEWLVSLERELPSNPRYFIETAALL